MAEKLIFSPLMLPRKSIKVFEEDLPPDFYGRVTLIYEAGKVRRMELQQSFHLQDAGKRETN